MKTINQDISYSFIDIRAFSELRSQPQLLQQLIKLYQDIFAEPDIWNESYSAAHVKQKLENELQGTASLRLCVTSTDQKNVPRKVIGFCWAQILQPQDVVNAIEGVPYIQEHHLAVSNHIRRIAGHSPVIYLQDLGIAKEYRQHIPLDQLIAPVLEDTAQRSDLRDVFFWSVNQTCISWLATKFGIPKVYEYGNTVFFKGELPSPTYIQHVINLSA